MTYTKKEIQQRSGLTERQVQFYTEYLNILDQEECHVGRGNFRSYSEIHLFVFCIIKELRDTGFATNKIRKILGRYKKNDTKA